MKIAIGCIWVLLGLGSGTISSQGVYPSGRQTDILFQGKLKDKNSGHVLITAAHLNVKRNLKKPGRILLPVSYASAVYGSNVVKIAGFKDSGSVSVLSWTIVSSTPLFLLNRDIRI